MATISNNQYATIRDNAEMMGMDWSWIGPAIGGVGQIVGGVMNKKTSPPPPPPPAPFPIIPVAVGGGILMMLMVVMTIKK